MNHEIAVAIIKSSLLLCFLPLLYRLLMGDRGLDLADINIIYEFFDAATAVIGLPPSISLRYFCLRTSFGDLIDYRAFDVCNTGRNLEF